MLKQQMLINISSCHDEAEPINASSAQQGFLLAHQLEKFLFEAGIVTKISSHNRIDHAGLRLSDAPPFHAVVLSFDDDSEALRFAEFFNFVGQNHDRFFLNMRP